ncbi:MAG: endolytic transglycosylase MltG [Beijerinckiaceae bacterium]
MNRDVSEAARQASMGARRAAPRSPKEAIEPVPAPPPPPRLKMRHRPFVTYGSNFFTILLVLVAIAAAGAFFLVRNLDKPGPLTEDRVMVVRGGTWDIAEQLEQANIISDPYSFMFAVMTNAKGDRLKAGEYLFKKESSITQVVATLVEGRSILHSVTIPEGLTSEQIIARLAESDVLAGEVREIPPEGSLLPDTYRVERGMSRQQLVARMQDMQRRTLNEIFSKRSPDNPIKSARELVILASIVEKETGRADERTRVAGVFINRMNKRMRLQSDPTIVYGLVGGKGTLGRGITREEINRATPYNTYVIEGLPPGPIANPGRAAMEAVANPSRTNDLFFVADGTGGHAFAETLDQHNRNVARWRQIERSRPATDAPKPVDRFEDDTQPAPAAPPRRSDVAPALESSPTTGSIAGADATQGSTGAPRARITDATEGTAKDPLKFKNFDLNSNQTIPKLKR